MDLSNHTYKTGSGCGWMCGVWVGVGLGVGGVGVGGGRCGLELTLDVTINCYFMDLTPIVDVYSTVKLMDKCYRLTVIVRCVVF